jgi:hypothetical protein
VSLASQVRSWGTGPRRVLREFGWSLGALYIVHRVIRGLSRGRLRIVPYGLYAQRLGVKPTGPVRHEEQSSVLRVSLEMPVATELPRPAEVIRERFAAGSECRVALVKGNFAGMIWTSRGRHVEDEVRCEYVLDDALDAWDFDVYVVPRYRFGRTFARLWQAVDDHLSADGAEWSFSRISLFNRPSVIAHTRLGAQRVGRVVFVVAGHWQLAIADTGPRLHVARGKNTVGPRLHLHRPPQSTPSL